MQRFAAPVWEIPSLQIAGQAERFPVRRIFCVGRNYSAHVAEMGGNPNRVAPFFFMKPNTALLSGGGELPYPSATKDLHHEVELVVAMKGSGRRVTKDKAETLISGYAVGIDMTRRDLQSQAKSKGHPWEASKAFDFSAPCGAISPAEVIGHLNSGAIWLDVNGQRRQEGDIAQLVWNVPEIIEQLSALFEILPGDLIFTGTPAGVGAVNPGDTLRAGVAGLSELEVQIGEPV